MPIKHLVGLLKYYSSLGFQWPEALRQQWPEPSDLTLFNNRKSHPITVILIVLASVAVFCFG